MKTINDWPKLIAQGTPIVGLEYYSADRQQVLSTFAQFACHQSLNAYYWNSAYSAIQVIKYSDNYCILEPVNLKVEDDVLQFLLDSDETGIFLLEDILESANPSLPLYRVSQLANAFFQSDRALAKILETAEHLGGCVLFADDFDKGFAGWDSNADGGVARRLSQKLLTWMQEHTSDVLMLATVNRLGMLPPELIRRFDDGGIWFVDLPHNGARYEIFNLHLAKYFPQQFGEGQPNPWSDRQWYSLLSDYAGATPAEIGNAVKRCAERAYCEGRPGKIELADLRYQRTQFVFSSQRSSEDIQAIRNQASFAKPASGEDVSKFAVTEQELFEYKAPIYQPID